MNQNDREKVVVLVGRMIKLECCVEEKDG